MFGYVVATLHALLYRKKLPTWRGKAYCSAHPSARVMRVFPSGEDSYPMCTKCLEEAAAVARKAAGR